MSELIGSKTFLADYFTGDRAFLFDKHLRHLRGQRCRLLEIGSHEGRSACWLIENIATAADATLTCVDRELQPVFWPNIRVAGGDGKVDMKIGHSHDVLPLLERNAFDFIYVDGSHLMADVLGDAFLVFPLAKKGALIAFDDYPWEDSPPDPRGAPKPAIDIFLEFYRKKIRILTKDYQVWVRKIAD